MKCLVLLSFFFWPLYCLSSIDLRLLIIPLVSSNSPQARTLCYYLYSSPKLWQLCNEERVAIHCSLTIKIYLTFRMDFCPNLLFRKATLYSPLHLTKKKWKKEAVFWSMCVLRQIYSFIYNSKCSTDPPQKLTGHSNSLKKY